MSTMIECDRCGRMFKVERGATALDEYGTDEGSEFGCEAWCSYNLCPECSEQFRAFMNGGKKE